jgi:hypothetical protein
MKGRVCELKINYARESVERVTQTAIEKLAREKWKKFAAGLHVNTLSLNWVCSDSGALWCSKLATGAARPPARPNARLGQILFSSRIGGVIKHHLQDLFE